MQYSSVSQLPESVRDVLNDPSDLEVNRRLRYVFNLTNDQYNFVLDTVLEIVLGQIPVLDLPNRLSQMPSAEQVDIQALSRSLAEEKLWPLQQHLGNVDRLITRLGGNIPSSIVDLSGKQSDQQSQNVITGKAKEILRDHRDWEEYLLTKKPIHDFDNKLRPPTVKNWLEEYLHEMGARGSDTLKRTQFLAQSYNASQLNDAEKQNLLNFLASYEDNREMYWTIAEEKYLVVETEPPKEVQEQEQKVQSKRKMEDLVELYGQIQENYRKQFEEMRPGLEMETNREARKLFDVVWDALGLGEVDRCLAALALLADKKMLLEMLKTDRRFSGIVTRDIDAKYGSDAKRYWKSDLSSAMGQAMFWKLILVKKLGLEENKAAIIADLYRKKLGYSVSSIYLDLQKGSFRFREISYHDRSFSFAN